MFKIHFKTHFKLVKRFFSNWEVQGFSHSWIHGLKRQGSAALLILYLSESCYLFENVAISSSKLLKTPNPGVVFHLSAAGTFHERTWISRIWITCPFLGTVTGNKGMISHARVRSVRDFAYHIHWNPTEWVSRQCAFCFSPHAPSLSKNVDHQWSRIQNFFDLGDMIKCIFYLLLNTHNRVWRNIPYTNILVFLLQNLGIFIEIRKKKHYKYLIISFFCQLSLPWVHEIFQLIQL